VKGTNLSQTRGKREDRRQKKNTGELSKAARGTNPTPEGQSVQINKQPIGKEGKKKSFGELGRETNAAKICKCYRRDGKETKTIGITRGGSTERRGEEVGGES